MEQRGPAAGSGAEVVMPPPGAEEFAPLPLPHGAGASATPTSETDAARGDLFGPLVSSDTESAHFAQFAPQAAAPAAAPAAKRAAGPKKSATPKEVKAIDALIARGKAEDERAAELSDDAAILEHSGDHQAALAKEREAWQHKESARGAKQEAIAQAVSAYGIDVSHTKSLLYDPNIDDAQTSEDANVTIGDPMFTDAACLASTIGHESEIHVNQQLMKDRNYPGPQGTALNEIEAYDYEIRSAKRFGLSAEEVAGLRRNRDHYRGYLDGDHLKQAKAGNYHLAAGHEEE